MKVARTYPSCKEAEQASRLNKQTFALVPRRSRSNAPFSGETLWQRILRRIK